MAFGHRNLIKKKLEDAEMSFHFNTLTLAIGTGISLELDPRIKVAREDGLWTQKFNLKKVRGCRNVISFQYVNIGYWDWHFFRVGSPN